MTCEVRLEDLLGRRVRAMNGRIMGRIEEMRAEWHGRRLEVTDVLIGSGALVERLALTRWILRRRLHLLVARWDQIELAPDDDAKLTCPVAELRTE